MLGDIEIEGELTEIAAPHDVAPARPDGLSRLEALRRRASAPARSYAFDLLQRDGLVRSCEAAKGPDLRDHHSQSAQRSDDHYQ